MGCCQEQNGRGRSRLYVPANLMGRAPGRLEGMRGNIEQRTFAVLRLGGGSEHQVDFEMLQPMQRRLDKMQRSVRFVGGHDGMIVA